MRAITLTEIITAGNRHFYIFSTRRTTSSVGAEVLMNLCLCFRHLLKAVCVCEYAFHTCIWSYTGPVSFTAQRTMCGYCVYPVKSLTPWSGCTTTSAAQSVHHLEWQAHAASSVPLSRQSLMFMCKDTSLKSTSWNDLN